jgi:hypothetical protein
VELYILDPLLRRQYVYDRFISLIWTERWNTLGDFQLDVVSTQATRAAFTPDTYLAMNRSNYVMRIESVEDDVTADGVKTLIVKGSSIEKILSDRVAYVVATDTTTTPNWTITDKPAAIMRTVFHDICILGALDAEDIIPGVTEGSFLPASTLAEPTDPITVQITPTDVYSVENQIGSAWNLGFRILRQDSTGQLFWEVYAGSDRTTAQTALTPVIFGPNLDNLQNTKELTDISKAKNVAYVYSPAGFQKVYAPGVDITVDGFERRVLVVNASDITSAALPNVTAALTQRGYQALAAARTSQLFDGEISQYSQYKYGVDYNLGDTVEMQNIDGVSNVMRVTEQIFTEDSNGEREYPTLVLNTYINTGSWLSEQAKQWIDFDSDTTSVWGNQA